MRLLQFVAVVCGMFCLAGSALAADNATKILGTWEAVKGEIPPGTTVEFTKDGKLKVVVKNEDKTITIEGTYKVKGDTLEVTTNHKGEEKTETIKLKTLTDTKLVTENEKGSIDELK